MRMTTISVNETTLTRLNSNKGVYQARVGHDVTSEEFINHLLDGFELGNQFGEAVENSSTTNTPSAIDGDAQ